MAILFPFDPTLKGYREVVELDPSSLTIPIFVLPKGSFFVNETFFRIKGTDKILKPGLDYRVLSCNEKVPYSDNADINTQIKNSYVRNAILLRRNITGIIECHVAYCGGEDESKAAQYTNYLNELYQKAMLEGTVSELTTPNQGWGNFLSSNNTQITQGKYIDVASFRNPEDIEVGGGLGWSKVDLSMQSIADTIAYGNDPLILQAFFNWIEHHQLCIDEKLTVFQNELRGEIAKLDGTRVAKDQFIHTTADNALENRKFISHHNVILRGLDPANSTEVLGKVQGYGPKQGSSALRNVGLYQYKDKTHIDQRLDVTVTAELRNDSYSTRGMVKVYIDVAVVNPKPESRRFWLKIQSESKNAELLSSLVSVSLPKQTIIYNYDIRSLKTTGDTLYIYIVDDEMKEPSYGGAHLVIDAQLNPNDYGLIISDFNYVSPDGISDNATVTVAVTRAPSQPSVTSSLEIKNLSGTNIGFINSNAQPNTNYNIVWGIGETKKVLPLMYLKFNPNNTDGIFQIAHTLNATTLASVHVFKNTAVTNFDVAFMLTDITGATDNNGSYLTIFGRKPINNQAAMDELLSGLKIVNNTTGSSKQLPTDGMFINLSGDSYILPLNLNEYAKGTLVTIKHDSRPFSLNLLVGDNGKLSLIDPLDIRNIVVRIVGIYKSTKGLMARFNFFNGLNPELINTKFSRVGVKISGVSEINRVIEFRPDLPVNVSIDVPVANLQRAVPINVQLDSPTNQYYTTVTLPNYAFSFVNEDGVDMYSLNKLNFNTLKFLNTRIKPQIINLLSTAISVTKLDGSVVDVPSGAVVDLAGFISPRTLSAGSYIKVDLKNGTEPIIEYLVGSGVNLAVEYLSVSNTLSGKATYHLNIENNFEVWLSLPENLNRIDVDRFVIENGAIISENTFADNVISLRIRLDRPTSLFNLQAQFKNPDNKAINYIANLIVI